MIIYLDKNFNPVDMANSDMAKVIPEDGSPPYFIVVENNGLKSIGTYSRQLWRYCLDLYRSGDGGTFLTQMIDTIANQMTRAWNDGAREVGVEPEEMTDIDLNELKAIIDSEYDHVIDLGDAIQRARSGTLDEFRQQFRPRVDLWVSRYNDAANRAKVYFGGRQRLVWTLGATEEHCTTCAKLNGIVAFAYEWEQSGIRPQSPPNETLECGGWKCDCSLMPTDNRRSPDALGTLMDIATAANIEDKSIKYSPDQPRVPAGEPNGGEWVSESYNYVPEIIGDSNYQGEFSPTEKQLKIIKKRISMMDVEIKKLEPINEKHRKLRKLNGDTIIIKDELLIGIMPNESRYTKPMGTAYSKGNGIYLDEQFIGTPIQDHEYIHSLLFRNKSIWNGLYENKYNPPYYFYHAEWAQNKNGEQIAMLLTGFDEDREIWINNIISSDPGTSRSRNDANMQIVELSRFLKEIGIW